MVSRGTEVCRPELLLSVALFVAFCALPPALTITTVVEEPVVQVV